MSKLLGCVLILSGVAVAGLALPLSGDRSEAAVELAGDPRNNAPGADAPALPSAPVSAKPALAAVAPSAAQERPQRKPIAPFQTVTVPNDPVSIARALQKELRRVGCYGGEINGVWSQPSKRAMKAFTERVNASLPLDKPDYILLTLVQGQADKICGDTCPAGQVLADNGRCNPPAILAQAARRAPPAQQRVAAVTPPAAAPGHTVNTLSTLKPSSAPLPAVPGEQPRAGWVTSVKPAAPAVEARPFPADTPRMALAGPTPPEAMPAAKPAAAATPDAEKVHRNRDRARARAERERRRHYAQVPKRSSTWVREFFRKLDNDVF